MAIGSAFPDGSLVGGQPMIGLAGFSTDFHAAQIFQTVPSVGMWSTAGAGTVTTVNSQPNGVLVLTPNIDVGLQIRTKGLHWRLTRGKRLWWGARLNLQNFDAVSWFAGICIDDSIILSTFPANMVGFINDNDDGTIDAISRKASVESRDEQVGKGFTADNQWRDLKFIWNGHGRINYYIDGAETQLHTANVPTDVAVHAAFEFAGEAGTQVNNWIDYFYCWQER